MDDALPSCGDPGPAPPPPTGRRGSHLHGVKAQVLSRPTGPCVTCPRHPVLSLPSSSFQRGAATPELLVARLPVCDVPADPAGASGAVKEQGLVGGGRRARSRLWAMKNSVHLLPGLVALSKSPDLSGRYSHQMGHQFTYSGQELSREDPGFHSRCEGKVKGLPQSHRGLRAVPPAHQAQSGPRASAQAVPLPQPPFPVQLPHVPSRYRHH